MSERVAIVGSRPPKSMADNYERHKWSEQLWTLIKGHIEAMPLDTVIVSGGADGADRMAVQAAKERGMMTVVFYPDWSKGRSAGAKRNQLIVNDCDRVIAFWDGKSPGTKITIDMARRAGKPVEVVTIPVAYPANDASDGAIRKM